MRTSTAAESTAMPDRRSEGADRAGSTLEFKPDAERYLDLLSRCLTASLYDESAWRIVEAETGRDRGTETSWAHRLRGSVRRTVIRALQRRGLMLVRPQRFDAERRAHGADWPCFGYTMVGHQRLRNVRRCIEDVLVRGVPGDLVEAGSWRGGTTIWMRAILQQYGIDDRAVWVCDSFEGLPPATDATDGPDLSHVDHLRCSLEAVQRNFARFGLLDDQVRFLKGWFADTLPSAPIDRIAVLRLDGDMYASTMDTLEPLYDRVSPGGWIIVDDYYSWDGCRRAVQEFLGRRGLRPSIERIDWTGACWRKEDVGEGAPARTPTSTDAVVAA